MHHKPTSLTASFSIMLVSNEKNAILLTMENSNYYEWQARDNKSVFKFCRRPQIKPNEILLVCQNSINPPISLATCELKTPTASPTEEHCMYHRWEGFWCFYGPLVSDGQMENILFLWQFVILKVNKCSYLPVVLEK